MANDARPFRRKRVRLLRLSALPIIFIPFVIRTDITDHLSLDFALEAMGYMLLMAGMGLRIWSTLYIGGRKSRELVHTGPYSICRNPLYLGTFAIVSGVAFLFTSLPMLLGMLLLFLPVTLTASHAEERNLEEVFGDEFRDYCRKVKRFWPSLRNYSSPERLEISTRIIGRVAAETAGILLVPLAEDLLDILHANHVLPVLWTLKW